ncbi:hypothetical protein AGMMS4952_19030 [Spirochaetia bacterium]|nr:hypothetical protein AGMMS4952_19030 [Spirochaetia bacterium]
MSGIFDYIEWRGDLSFESDPFNAVDNIIFSVFSYYPLDGIVPNDFEQKPVLFTDAVKALIKQGKNNPEIQRHYIYKTDQTNLLEALLDMPRYKNIKLCAYVNKIDQIKEMQFSALTFVSHDCPSYVAYRGTDLTLVGWKEDFNMIFTEVIPAQMEAVAYLNTISDFLKKPFYVGGHSKGGNLAVYAASFCDPKIQNRILSIYNNDAPGFNKKTTCTKEYKAIEKKIQTYIPQDSVIGLLFEHQRNYTVVRSTENVFMQHNPFSWHVLKNDVVHVEQITKQSKFINKTLMIWLDGMDHQTRQQFIDSLYDILVTTEVKSIPEFTDKWLTNTITLLKSMNNLDKETKDMLHKTFNELFEIAGNRFSLLIRRRVRTKEPAYAREALRRLKS